MNTIFGYYNGSGGSSTLVSLTNGHTGAVGPGAPGDATMYFKLTYSDAGGAWAGWFDTFNANQDISSYTYLKLYVMGAVGGETFQVDIGDQANYDSGNNSVDIPNQVTITATTSWVEWDIPLTSFYSIASGHLTTIKRLEYNIYALYTRC